MQPMPEPAHELASGRLSLSDACRSGMTEPSAGLRRAGPGATRDDCPLRNGPLYGVTATWE